MWITASSISIYPGSSSLISCDRSYYWVPCSGFAPLTKSWTIPCAQGGWPGTVELMPENVRHINWFSFISYLCSMDCLPKDAACFSSWRPFQYCLIRCKHGNCRCVPLVTGVHPEVVFGYWPFMQMSSQLKSVPYSFASWLLHFYEDGLWQT